MNRDLQMASEQRPIGLRQNLGGGTMVLLLCLLALGSGMTLAQGRELATAIEVTLRESGRGEPGSPSSRTVRSLGQTVSKIVRRVTKPAPALPGTAPAFEPADWTLVVRTVRTGSSPAPAIPVRVALLDLPPPVC